LLQYTFQVSIIDYIFFNFYLFIVSSKSTFSLLFGALSNIDLFFIFLSIDSQPDLKFVVRQINYFSIKTIGYEIYLKYFYEYVITIIV